MDLKQELENKIKTITRSAKLVFDSGDYTSASILYFKALFALCDYILLISGFEVPKDHDERFRTLEKRMPRIYWNLHTMFPIYRRSYKTTISKNECEKVKNYVEALFTEAKLA